jgi:hypothetical protein
VCIHSKIYSVCSVCFLVCSVSHIVYSNTLYLPHVPEKFGIFSGLDGLVSLAMKQSVLYGYTIYEVF